MIFVKKKIEFFVDIYIYKDNVKIFIRKVDVKLMIFLYVGVVLFVLKGCGM